MQAEISLAFSCSVHHKKTAGLRAEAQNTSTHCHFHSQRTVSHGFPLSSQLPARQVLCFWDDLIIPRWEGTRQKTHALTYRDSVDGVGVTVIVAVVTVLPAIATGHDKNAPKAPATRYHTMLQGSL